MLTMVTLVQPVSIPIFGYKHKKQSAAAEVGDVITVDLLVVVFVLFLLLVSAVVVLQE